MRIVSRPGSARRGWKDGVGQWPPMMCQQGHCSYCSVRPISGEWRHPDEVAPYVLPEEMRPCSAEILSETIIEI